MGANSNLSVSLSFTLNLNLSISFAFSFTLSFTLSLCLCLSAALTLRQKVAGPQNTQLKLQDKQREREVACRHRPATSLSAEAAQTVSGWSLLRAAKLAALVCHFSRLG